MRLSIGDGLKPKKRPAGFDPKKATATDHYIPIFCIKLLHVTALLIASNPRSSGNLRRQQERSEFEHLCISFRRGGGAS